MKNNLKKMGWVLLMVLTIYSCKKGQSQPDFEESAKSWYLKTSQKSSYALVSNKNTSEQVSRALEWKDAKTFTLNDGTEVLGVPMKLKFANGKTPTGGYMLMIGQNAGGFKHLTVYNSDKDFFKKISKEQVQVSYTHGIEDLRFQKLGRSNAGKGKLMSEENGGGESDQPVCTDWYLVETFRDADGNITGIMETYLFTTCSTAGGGAGGGGGEGDSIDWGTPVDEDLSETAIPEEDMAGEKIESRHYKWTFHRAYNEGFWLKSYEKGKVKKIGSGPWKYTSFTHLTAAPIGMVAGREIELVMIDSEVEYNTSDAKVSLWYKIHRIGNGFGTVLPYYSGDFSKNKTFYANAE